MPHPRRLYAHRGAAAEFPENTLLAFHRALEIGAHAIETDVHMTRDGHLVISHDPEARRMAGAGGRWRDMDLDQARALDLGWGFVDGAGARPFAGRGIRIPTLEEALVELPGARFNVDLKQASPSMVPTVLALLRRLRAEERVVLASFQLRTLLAVRRGGFAGRTALSQPEVILLAAAPVALFRRLPLLGTVAQVPLFAGPVRFDRAAFVDKCHALGMRVDYWTVNDPGTARRLLELGADGIMSDDPAALVSLFAA
jgi:glycerophosphoryl diester phosphodiesterase